MVAAEFAYRLIRSLAIIGLFIGLGIVIWQMTGINASLSLLKQDILQVAEELEGIMQIH